MTAVATVTREPESTGVEVRNIRDTQGVAVLRPIITAAALIETHKEIAELVNRVLHEGTDFGVIPGTGNKPALLKPGAERLSIAFALRPEFDVLEQDVDHFREVPWTKRKKVWRNAHQGDRQFTWAEEAGNSTGFYRYVVRCRLIRRDTGEEMGQGVGCCTTLESKYIDRPRESENTVLKMAKKRAHVDAVLTALGLSDRFTQDVEDTHGQRPENVDPDGVVAEPLPTKLPGDETKWKLRRDDATGHGGKLFTEVPEAVLVEARDWFKGKDAKKNERMITAIDAELLKRSAPGKPNLDEPPPALAGDDDDLPF